MMVKISRNWSKKLHFALWAYQTSFCTFTGATPYSLVYGMEADSTHGSLALKAYQQNLYLEYYY